MNSLEARRARHRSFPRGALEQSIPARFASCVAEGPERLAVRSGSMSLSYRALDRYANGIAQALLAAVGPASAPVILLLDQGVPLLAAILGTLKAGKFYVPLDPSFPPAHLARQAVGAGARVAIVSRGAGALLAALETEGLRTLEIETIDPEAGHVDPALSIPPDAGAYVYYTSGSTGRAKGVLDSHRNVLHNVMRYTNTLAIGPDDRLTLLQGPSFSGAVSSMFGALLNGASTFPFDVPRNGVDRIGPWLDLERITIYHSVPALFRRVVERGPALPTVRCVRLEGDQASPRDLELFHRHLARGTVLVNGLGATECGIVRQFFVDHDTPVPEATVPIGYPVEDMHVVLVDDAGHEVAAGEVGEIVVKSRYLALGYWHDAELTAAAFSDETDGSRAYRTGDLGRLREDGCLEHLGRKDFQLKVGGHRIETAEIESALLEMEGVKEAAVATCRGPGDEPRLVAYVVPTVPPGPTVSVVRRRLAGQLPPFMVPSAYVMLDALPLNANAKVDRRALPAPTGHRPFLDVPCDTPGTLLQQQLVPIWEAVLGVSPVGIRDDFFDLGGSSLLAHRMIAEVERVVGRRVSHSAMLAGSTIERLAAAIQDETDHPDRVVKVQGGGPRPPFFFLHGDYLGGFYCTELARRIGTDQPFYALPPYGLDGGPIPASYEAMAEGHVASLRAVCPKGPYRLGGLCNGGLVALEMARRIVREGEHVDRLILIAASALNVRWRPVRGPVGTIGWWMRRGSSERFDRFVHRVCRWDALDGPARARLVLRALAGALRRDSGSTAARPPATANIPESRRQMRAAYRRLDKDYTPAPYQGPLTVLWPAEDIERVNAQYWWSTVAKDLDFRVVPGTHVTCPTLYVDALADEVRRCLAEEPPDGRTARRETRC